MAHSALQRGARTAEALAKKKTKSTSSAKYIAIYYLDDSVMSNMVGFFPPCLLSKDTKMHEKYRYGLWGAAAGAIALTVVGFTWGGWSTSAGTAKQVEVAVLTALIPICAKDVMADPEAVAELKVKRPIDYDDVVRDYRKRTGTLTNLSFQFNRDCGKAIEAIMAKSATKS